MPSKREEGEGEVLQPVEQAQGEQGASDVEEKEGEASAAEGNAESDKQPQRPVRKLLKYVCSSDALSHIPFAGMDSKWKRRAQRPIS